MDNPAWPTSVPFGWSVEWDPSPTGSDPRPWAKLGVHLRYVCSRVIISFCCEFGQAVLLVSINMVCISLFELNLVCNNVWISVI
jgi:hypothetical protein